MNTRSSFQKLNKFLRDYISHYLNKDEIIVLSSLNKQILPGVSFSKEFKDIFFFLYKLHKIYKDNDLRKEFRRPKSNSFQRYVNYSNDLCLIKLALTKFACVEKEILIDAFVHYFNFANEKFGTNVIYVQCYNDHSVLLEIVEKLDNSKFIYNFENYWRCMVQFNLLSPYIKRIANPCEKILAKIYDNNKDHDLVVEELEYYANVPRLLYRVSYLLNKFFN